MINLSSSGPGLPFWRFGFGFFGILYYYHSGSCLGMIVVPQPGIGPGRPEWARGCKPRLSANSSTGAHNKAPNVGAVTPAQGFSRPYFFRAGQRGPKSFSWRSSSARKNQSGNRRNQFLCDGARFRAACIRKPVFLSPPLPEGHYVTVFGQLVEDAIQSRSAVSASSGQAGKKFGTRYRVITANRFLPVEHNDNRIMNGRRSHRKRDVTPVVRRILLKSSSPSSAVCAA